MRQLLYLRVFIAIAALASCSSPSVPTGPGEPSTVVEGRTLDAIDSSGAGASVRVGTLTARTDPDGHFRIDVGRSGEFGATIQGNGYVERQTTVHTTSSQQMRLPLIPASFDLAAFHEMFRASGALQRWAGEPTLVLLTSVMKYNGPSETSYESTGERLTNEELDQMEAHFTEGLRLLTGGTYTSFHVVQREDVAKGQRAGVLRNGAIVAGRYTGIVSWSNTIGLGRWQVGDDFIVTAGAVFLDRDFDRDDQRRRLLRIHELGHALGYMHVTTRPSVMNPSIGPEPTDFDAHGAIIAFQRYPGNRPPDVDPSFQPSTPFLTTSGTRRWGPPILCGMPRS
jgi:hypothetical protein